MQKVVSVSAPAAFWDSWRRVLAAVSLALLSAVMLADFIFRGLTTAFYSGRTDFLDVYVGAWLWRHGQNFYDPALATGAALSLAGSNLREAIVYPPSAFAAFVPFSLLPWGRANFLCMLLSLIGVGISIYLLLRIGNFTLRMWGGWLVAVFVLAFDPIHQGFHLANMALLVVPICLGGILLAERRQDFTAGFLLALATALKPQLGLWVLLFYLIRLRKWFVVGAALPAIFFLFEILRYPVPLGTLLASYRLNLQYHFGAGGHFGFAKGALPFHVNLLQVVIYQLWPSVRGVNWLAHGLFAAGLVLWAYAFWRSRFSIPAPLAISSLLALSFISLYHGVYDASILILAACWAFKGEGEKDWSRPRRLTCGVLLLMALPGHSLLMRLSPHLSASITNAWWWNLFVARYFVWLLLALNIVLLAAVWKSRKLEPAKERVPAVLAPERVCTESAVSAR